ncbi:hypothetical protein [Dyella amyloliquefaciens]|uniref:hypothetical protein n=1 Tax=Dyella amyloliquefaciens TaxID=1770545 RepID=UPI00102E512F|nr:hypothetical protein [Dyella amyloliquefaciens]
MSKFHKSIVVLALLSPVCAFATSAFDGTWKVDMSQVQLSKKPSVIVLQSGMYDCKSCVPHFMVKADGQDHPITGNPYFDAAAVEVVDAHTVKITDKKGGKVVASVTSTVSPDGKTVHDDYTDSSNTNSAPITGSEDWVKVAAGPVGSHARSGTWQAGKVTSVSDNAVTWTMKETGGMFSMTAPTGQSYNAKVDGTEAPFVGDPGVTSVTVKLTGNTLVESEMRAGKVISVQTSTVSADGKSMKVVSEDKQRNRTTTFVALKQ